MAAAVLGISAVFGNSLVVTGESSSEPKPTKEVEQGDQKGDVYVPDELKQLYAQSVCLLDGESGRVLFEKNGSNQMAMASTTKIMTCIVALENGNLDDVVTISKKAAGQPDVQLNAVAGDQFKLKNLLYSLMLESHNDSAVAIAEHIGGSVEGFAQKMNQKARDIGCMNAHFVTPNGLDKADAGGDHSITAIDLAAIMRYCIKQSPKAKDFLEITRTPSVSFSNESGKRSYSLVNHNAFLSMMEGALSGKTGFTNKAGYCYVGALERDGKTLIVAVLACGWPNHKTWKWSDTRKLMEYGLKNYSYRDVLEKDKTLENIPVHNGIPASQKLTDKATTGLAIDFKEDTELKVLLKENEEVNVIYSSPKSLNAPVKEGTVVGSVKYSLNDTVIRNYPIYVTTSVEKLNYKWCLKQTWNRFLIGHTCPCEE